MLSIIQIKRAWDKNLCWNKLDSGPDCGFPCPRRGPTIAGFGSQAPKTTERVRRGQQMASRGRTQHGRLIKISQPPDFWPQHRFVTEEKTVSDYESERPVGHGLCCRGVLLAAQLARPQTARWRRHPQSLTGSRLHALEQRLHRREGHRDQEIAREPHCWPGQKLGQSLRVHHSGRQGCHGSLTG